MDRMLQQLDQLLHIAYYDRVNSVLYHQSFVHDLASITVHVQRQQTV
jgi:hypothetical protein